ncbi:MAG: M23 family metallopeptidase [bacterium]
MNTYLILLSFILPSLLLSQQISRECTLKTNKDTKAAFSMESPSNSSYESCTDEQCRSIEKNENDQECDQTCNQNSTESKFTCCVPCNGAVTSGFCTKKRPDHKGLDYNLKYGSVFAAHDGIVRACRFSNVYPEGKYIILETEDGQYQTHYYHLAKLDISICEKEKDEKGNLTKPKFIKQGTYIAESGNTGESTGAHLHFTLKVCQFYRKIGRIAFEPIDPTPFFIDVKKTEAITYVPKK